jgi:hypothetical protein
MTTSISRLFLLFAICAWITCAQDAAKGVPSKSGDPSGASSAGATDVPRPAAAIESLAKALTGRWSTREKYERMFLTPDGGVGNGEQVFRPGPGGFTLLEDYHSQTPAGELLGFGLLWWDQTKGLQHMWCVNIYPTGCEMFPAAPQAGPKWDGKRLIIHIAGEQVGDSKVDWQEILFDMTPDSFTQTVDIGAPDGPLKRWLTIHSTKMTTRAKEPSK